MSKYKTIILMSFAVLLFIISGCQSSQSRVEPSSSDNLSVAEYAGTLKGSWYGDIDSGTFIMNISETGKITGSYSGDYSGSIKGQVDSAGKFTATAGGSDNTTVTWKGRFKSVNGMIFSGSGTWYDSMDSSNGTWRSN